MRNTPAVPWAYVRGGGLADLGRDLEDIYQHEFQPDVAKIARAVVGREEFEREMNVLIGPPVTEPEPPAGRTSG